MDNSSEKLSQCITDFLHKSNEHINKIWELLRTKIVTKRVLMLTKKFIYSELGKLNIEDRLEWPNDLLLFIDEEFDYLRKRYNDLLGYIDCKLIELESNPPINKIVIPHKLKTKEADEIFQRAINAGFMNEKFEWLDTLQLLAYFAEKMSHHLDLTTKMDKDGNIVTLWQPFENLFQYKGKKEGVNKIKNAKQNWMKSNTKFEPTRFEKIDILFE